MSKKIVIAGFKGGVGKSTISNFLAEMLENTLVVSLDFMQNAEEYNTSKTINLAKKEDINLFFESKKDISYFIIDAGGFDDERLSDIDIDLLILPTKTGYRSIKTTVDSAVTFSPINTPVMFILNDYTSQKEQDDTLEILEEILKMSKLQLDNLYFFGIQHSNAIKSSENKNASLADLASQSKLMARAYSKVIATFKELAAEIIEIIGE